MDATRLYTEPFRGRTWRETAYALLALPVGVLWFTLFVTLLSTSLGLLITFVGVPLLVLTFHGARFAAQAERGLARELLGVEVVTPPEPAGAAGKPWWRRELELLVRPAVWRELVFLFLRFPLGIASFVVAVVMWSLAVGLLTMPLWFWTVPDGDFLWEGNRLDNWYEVALSLTGGLAALLATPWVVRGTVWFHTALLRALCGPTRGELERAAEVADVQRTMAVSSAASELRRIERDLHDGAQARLVSLAVDLGRARDRLERGAPVAEAIEILGSAQEEARVVLKEIRDLARGIHPAILEDRGLDAALSSLAAKLPVPVALEVDLAERPRATVESAAYFVVAEALTNVTRHSGATRAAVRVARLDDTLRVEVRDDGRGGAELRAGSGLDGLRDRVGSLGGRLEVDSPTGWGTTVIAELPCA